MLRDLEAFARAAVCHCDRAEVRYFTVQRCGPSDTARFLPQRKGTRFLAKKGSKHTHKRKTAFEHAACLTSLFDTTAFCHLDAVFFCHVAACSHCSDTKTALEKKGKFRGDAIESALPGLESIVQPGVDVHAAHCGAASGSGAAVQTPSVYGRTGGAEGSEGWKCLRWCDWCGRDYRHRPRCNQAVRR